MSVITKEMKDHPISRAFSELSALLYILSPSRTSEELTELLKYDASYYSDQSIKEIITFIIDYYNNHDHSIPSYLQIRERFRSFGFPDDPIVYDENVKVVEAYIVANKASIKGVQVGQLLEASTNDTIFDAFDQIRSVCDDVSKLSTDSDGKRLKADALDREAIIAEQCSSAKIPTGIAEIDSALGGGLDTSEELFLLIARTNVGKSWVCAKFAASASKAGYNTLYYSPEMEGTKLLTRVDTWLGEGKFKNSDISSGRFSQDYTDYLHKLSDDEKMGEVTVIENTDVTSGVVNTSTIQSYILRNDIKLVIVDGLSYMEDSKKASNTSEKYRDICMDLLQMSKQYHCAVVIVMQANRETKNNTTDDDTKGFPDLYNVEGSDHPGRIATSAIALRRDVDETTDANTLSIRIQKLRNHGFPKNSILTYSWNQNIGEMSLKTDETNASFTTTKEATVTLDASNMPSSTNNNGWVPMFGNAETDSRVDDEDESIEF